MPNDTRFRFIPTSVRRRLEGRSQVQSILGNISWLSIDRLVRMGVGLAVGVWVARYLGPKQLGLLNFAAAFVSLFSPFAMLGLDSIAVRELVRAPGDKEAILGTSFVLKIAGSICAGVLSLVIIMVTRPGEQLTHLLVAISVGGTLFQALDVIDFWFQSRLQAKFVVFARNLAFLSIAMLKVILLLSRAPLVYFALAASAELVAGATGLVAYYRREGNAIALWRARFEKARSLLRDSWPLFLSGISVAIYMRIDQVMIGYMLNESAVGIYSVAIRLVEIWYFLPTAFASSVLPALIRAKSDNEEVYKRRLQTFYNFTGIVAIGIAAFISIFSSFIIGILYGATYADAAPILAVYAWATVPVFLGVASNQHFLVENRTRVLMYRTLAGLVTNVVLNFILIPAYGPIGAAVASLVSQTAVLFSIAFVGDSPGQSIMLVKSMNPISALRFFRSEHR